MRRLSSITTWALCVVLLLLPHIHAWREVEPDAAPANVEQRSSEGAAGEYDVVVSEAGPLGAHLDGQLHVTGFQSSRDHPSGRAYLERVGVLKGDRLLSIDNMPVDGMSPKDLRIYLQSQDRPFTLRLHAFDGQSRPQKNTTFRDEDEIKSEGHIDILDGPLSLFSLPVSRAKFGGPAACFRKPMTMAHPIHACGETMNEIAGSYVVVERGICSFATKAVNVQEQGGLGLIVINTDQGRFRMSGEDLFGNEAVAMEAIPSVMINPQDGRQLIKTLGSNNKAIFGRLVVSEECIREEGEWHRVHDVAWKNHPDLASQAAQARSQEKRAEMQATKPRVSAKGIRQPSDAERERKNEEEREAPAAAASKGATKEVTIIEDWERHKGLEGKIAAQRKVKKERADKARIAQGLRSGEIQLRSANMTYVSTTAWSHHDVESVLGAGGGSASSTKSPAAGPIIARVEFLASSSVGGAIPLGKRAIQYVEASTNCSHLLPWPKAGSIAVFSTSDLFCSLSQILDLMEKADVGLLVLTDPDSNEARPRSLTSESFDEDTKVFIETYLSRPMIEIGPDEGKHLIEHLLEPGAMIQAEVVDRPEIIELWHILESLKEVGNWPSDHAKQRRLLSHLKQRHDPQQDGGSIGRYKFLIEAFERLQQANGLPTSSSSSSIGGEL